MKLTVFKSGNSIAVVVPSKFAKDIALKPGDKVSARIDPKRGTITYTFPNSTQLALDLPSS